AEDGIRDRNVTGVQTCALPILGYQLWGETAHEWAGTGMLVLFIAHHLLNLAWYRNLFRGKYTVIRVLVSMVNLALLAVMICLMEIGRASCRERVYVEEGAGSIV